MNIGRNGMCNRQTMKSREKEFTESRVEIFMGQIIGRQDSTLTHLQITAEPQHILCLPNVYIHSEMSVSFTPHHFLENPRPCAGSTDATAVP